MLDHVPDSVPDNIPFPPANSASLFGGNGEDATLAHPAGVSSRSDAVPVSRDAKIARRVRSAVTRSLAYQHVTISDGVDSGALRAMVTTRPATRSDVIISLPRRKQTRSDPAEAASAWTPARMRLSAIPRVGSALLVSRLVIWLALLTQFAAATAWDVIRRRDSQERRAVRLRRAIERKGGTLVRIGRQMAVRLDILPVRYCEQLATMRDRMPPFATEDAIPIIERTTGRKLGAIFSTFDPVPIDSSSVSCVYQAILRATGEKVVVKVRRPGIHVQFEADFKVLVLLIRLAESLTLVHPGYGAGFYVELRKTLSDELDFRRGTRYEELFHRNARKSRKRFFDTPYSYHDLSNEEVLVQEFVSGMWLWEVIATLERQDPAGLALMRQLNIDPKKLAKRLLFIHYWAIYENVTFNADPQPANIIVRANGKLTFFNFGANGFISEPRRKLFSRFYAAQAQKDVWGMAQATIALLEPLPSRDLNVMAKEIEAVYYERLLAVKSKYSRWHERTSAAMWLAAFRVMYRYKVPAPMDVLMFARATLFYDTLAARLDPDIDYFKRLERYHKDVEKRQRKRGMKMLRRRLRTGLITDSEMALIENATSTIGNLFFRLQRLLNTPYDFAIISMTVEKWVVTFVSAVKFVWHSAILTGIGVAGVMGAGALAGQATTAETALRQVMNSNVYLLGVAALAVIHLRVILFRLNDKARKD